MSNHKKNSFVFKGRPSEATFSCAKLQQLGGDVDSDLYDTIEVLCINCYDFVQTTDIEAHSRRCMTVKDEVMKFDLMSPMEALKIRCNKLYDFLFSKSSDELPGDKNYLMILQRLCSNIAGVRGIADEEITKDVIAALNSIINYSHGSNVVMVYSERVKALAVEQLLIIEELKFKEAKSQIDSLKNQVEYFKQRTQLLERALVSRNIDCSFNPVEEVISDTGSVMSTARLTSSVSQTPSEQGQSDIDIDEVMPKPVEEKDNLQKYFYSHCLAIKLQFADRSVANEVPISWLYSKAVNERIPANEWPVFIRRQIELAVKNSEGKRRRAQPRGLQRRFKYVEAIAEE